MRTKEQIAASLRHSFDCQGVGLYPGQIERLTEAFCRWEVPWYVRVWRWVKGGVR